ncbi:DUF6596 domain-containing protein [Phycicoccus sp. CSK15P-2]|uniref:RNA polymerase sigma factor n=1 Tax=Phycicoccus sp. CSK15P-2 TaxID=2807627 RepID=UPI0027DD1360|nr:DUF6596 domain-containing protein [Phycicoccus sp. CSK15P-2]
MTRSGDALTTVDTLYRAEFGRIVAGLTRRFGDLSLAEEMTQEAFSEAVRRWPEEGIPPRPAGWLTVTARNKALDRVRRESTRDSRHQEAHVLYAHEDPGSTVSSVPDDRLRLLFTCCHPALARSAQVALTLRLLGGLTVPEVAHAFLVPERTMAQRITRAKRKIADARIPYRVPRDSELPQRLGGVLATLYLIYNEGYLAHGEEPVRTDLSAESIRLTRVLCSLMPDEPETTGLLALMLLSDARRPARVRDVDGSPRLVPLDEQDRRLWDRVLVTEGHELVRECLRRNRPGQYQLLAAIQAVHTDAVTFDDTDLGADPGPLRPAVRNDSHPGRGPQPRRRRRGGRGRRGGAASRRGPRAARLHRLPRDPCRPAAAAGPRRRGAGGLRPGPRAHDEPLGARGPRAPPRRSRLRARPSGLRAHRENDRRPRCGAPRRSGADPAAGLRE